MMNYTDPEYDDDLSPSPSETLRAKSEKVPDADDVILKCSMCGKPYGRSTSRFVPFCSRRCQQLDLGNWLDERYGLPV